MFTFEPGVIFWTLLSFGLTYFFINQKVYPPIKKMLDERVETISKNLAEADERLKNAEIIQKELDLKLRDIKLEELRIISEAKEKARALSEQYEKNAMDEYRNLRKQKEKDLGVLEKSFVHNSETKIVKLIINSCEKILKTEIPADLQHKIIDARIKELENINEI